MHSRIRVTVFVAAGLLVAATARAQSGSGAAPVPPPTPSGRVSFFTNTSRTGADAGPASSLGELATAFSYRLDEGEEDGIEYGVDLRHSNFTSARRPDRLSIYEAYAGARVGHLRVRGGQLWLNDLGSLGAVAGAAVEWRQARPTSTDGRLRVGAFGGLEPNILAAGYAPGVRKVGGYLTYEGRASRRHTVGYVRVNNQALVERSVLTTTSFLPVRGKLFVYQALEYDLRPLAGQADQGLTYFFATARVMPNRRFEVQGTHSRGHSVDVRGLSETILTGRAVSQAAVEGLLYESTGGRVTVEVAPRVRVYGGYSSDKNSRDSTRTGRVLIGGYASNVGGQGIDLSASDNIVDRPTGRYHSRYVSAGRQLGRHVYASVDYTTSLSIVRYSRSDGVTVETRPHTARVSGSTAVTLPGSMSLLLTVERTRDDASREFRVLAGLTYRMR